MGNHHKLNQTEREQLSRWKKERISNNECAKRLSRHPSTIGRELSRNGMVKWNKELFYEPLHAQAWSIERKEKAWKTKHPLKNKQIYCYIIEKLKSGWSPEQIAGRLKIDYLNDPVFQIHHETIYRYIYASKNKEKKLWEYLRRKQIRRRKKIGRKAHRVRIPDRISIHDRPNEVLERVIIGHWEGDTIVGKGRANGLHTTYERVSSLIRFERMNRLTANESVKAQYKIYSPLPQDMRKTITLDNGSEHVDHIKLKETLGIKTYFADPYSAYQRGGNENANLWIRYYFPKGTDFSTISNEDLKDVEWELNNRPRKRLGFKKPLEVFNNHLKGCDRK